MSKMLSFGIYFEGIKMLKSQILNTIKSTAGIPAKQAQVQHILAEYFLAISESSLI